MAHQGDGGGLNCHVAAAAHGDPHLGLGQRRGVVDTIAHHRDLTPLALQRLNRGGFAIRQYPGDNLVDPGLFSNSVGGNGVVTGEHDQTIASLMQALQCRHAILTQRIANGKQRCRLAVHRQQHRRCARGRLGGDIAFQLCGINTLFIQQGLVAQQQAATVALSAQAQPAQGTKVVHLRQRLRSGLVDNGAGQRMARTLLQRGSQAQRLLAGEFAVGQHGGNLRAALGKGAGLIKHQRIELAGTL